MKRNILIQKVCRECCKTVKMSVDPEGVRQYNEGEKVQDAFPYLTADEREILISGICGECFDKMFA